MNGTQNLVRSEEVELHPAVQRSELALATRYPITHSGDAARLKRAEDAIVVPPLRDRLSAIRKREEIIANSLKNPRDK
jgi:hypothetical protein